MNYKRLFIPNSIVFITAVTHHRKPILISHIELLRQAFHAANAKYPFKLMAFIVNPDHFHILIKPTDINTYPKIIGIIKRTFTKLLPAEHSLNTNREANVWQRRYWEHIIKNDTDLQKHLDYIHYNSVKHAGIAPKDWPYSSFRKFVEQEWYELEWYNVDDKNQISTWNME